MKATDVKKVLGKSITMNVKHGRNYYHVDVTDRYKADGFPLMWMVETHDQQKIISGKIKNGAYCPSVLERRIITAAIDQGILAGFPRP